jgi:hypothetical protein
MSKRKYLVLLLLSCLISWILWGLVLVFIAPDELGFLGVVLFLLTLILVFFTLSLIFFYFIQIRLLKKQSPFFKQFHIIFREALIFTGLILVVLYLLVRRF